MNPKIEYSYAKNILKGRHESAEHIIVRPYNFKLKRFVTKPDHYDWNMFVWALAYLRNVLSKRCCSLVVEEFKQKLEKQLLKHFDSSIDYDYARFLKGKLPEKLHNRMLMEAIANNNWAVKQYFSKFVGGVVKPKKSKNRVLSKPQIIFNYLLKNPSSSDKEVINYCYKIGVIIKKPLVTKIRNQLNAQK